MKNILTIALLVFVFTTPFNEVFARSVDIDPYDEEPAKVLWVIYPLTWILLCAAIARLYRPFDIAKNLY